MTPIKDFPLHKDILECVLAPYIPCPSRLQVVQKVVGESFDFLKSPGEFRKWYKSHNINLFKEIHVAYENRCYESLIGYFAFFPQENIHYLRHRHRNRGQATEDLCNYAIDHGHREFLADFLQRVYIYMGDEPNQIAPLPSTCYVRALHNPQDSYACFKCLLNSKMSQRFLPESFTSPIKFASPAIRFWEFGIEESWDQSSISGIDYLLQVALPTQEMEPLKILLSSPLIATVSQNTLLMVYRNTKHEELKKLLRSSVKESWCLIL